MNQKSFTHALSEIGGLSLACVLLTAPAIAGESAGSLVLSGDATFDSDSIASSNNQERRWLSYPGGRLCLNPASAGRFNMAPMDTDLSMDLGGYLGNRVVRLADVVTVRLCEHGSCDPATGMSVARKTTWYPYKIAFTAEFADRSSISGCDYFVDADSTLIRAFEVKSERANEICLGGVISASEGATWDDAAAVLVVSDARYFYALKFARVAGNADPVKALDQKPVVSGNSWSLKIPADAGTTTHCAISFGFAAVSEGRTRAVERALSAFAKPVPVSLAGAKKTMDDFLRAVPMPTRWGVDGVKTFGLTQAQHRQSYYAGWTFIYQSVMNVFPENPGYPYPQMSVGKSSLWAEGEKSCPATCGWESFMGLQWLSFIDPGTAWRGYEGIMSLVDEKGQLGGESLPSRKAQTAWVLHRRMPDTAKLKAVYPAIKRYLLWREQNLRWLFADRNIEEERDIEFVVSWLFDVDYAIKIAGALEMKAEVDFWQGKLGPMTGNMREWFFSDPAKLHQFYFVKEKKYNAKDRTSDRPIMTLTALCLKDLPTDMVARLKDHFREIHNPDKPNDGFEYTKYPDNNLDAYGLVDKGIPGAKEFMLALLRDSVMAGEFAETLELDKEGNVRACGVKPSLFNALNIVEFTWMLNGVRYESGQPVRCELK